MLTWWLSSAYNYYWILIEVGIYTLCLWPNSYLLLILVLAIYSVETGIDETAISTARDWSTADTGNDEAAIYCWYSY